MLAKTMLKERPEAPGVKQHILLAIKFLERGTSRFRAFYFLKIAA
jgi:hypothetical protein